MPLSVALPIVVGCAHIFCRLPVFGVFIRRTATILLPLRGIAVFRSATVGLCAGCRIVVFRHAPNGCGAWADRIGDLREVARKCVVAVLVAVAFGGRIPDSKANRADAKRLEHAGKLALRDGLLTTPPFRPGPSFHAAELLADER